MIVPPCWCQGDKLAQGKERGNGKNKDQSALAEIDGNGKNKNQSPSGTNARVDNSVSVNG